MNIPALLDSLAIAEPYYHEYLRAWVVADPDHIRSLARSPNVSAARTRSFLSRLPEELRGRVPHLLECREQLLLFRDGDGHRRLRAKTAALLASRLPLVREDIDSLWEEVWREAAGMPGFDAVETVLAPAVSRTMGVLLNCPSSVTASLRCWSENFNRSMSGDSGAADFERAETSLEELSNMLSGYEQGTLDGTWIEGLFRSCKPSFDWSERRQTLLLLMLAGFDTSISMLSNCLMPMLVSGRALGTESSSGYASDLTVQVTCPVKFTMREVVAPIQLEACEFAAGNRVLLSWYGGNKHLADEGALSDGGGFAFGVGAHSCLGKAVAMHQLQACFRGLDRIRRPLVLDAPVSYNGNLCFYYPSTMPVRWT